MAKTSTPRDASGAAANPETNPVRDRIQASGLRVTPVRLRVLQVLAQARAALSHAEIDAQLAAPLDRVTLYRTLDSFVSAGLAHKQVGAERVTRFALVDGADHSAHAHFTCDQCSTVYCMPAKPPRRAQLPEGFELAGAALHFHGACPACSKAIAR